MSSNVYSKKPVANAVPESTKMSPKHAVNVFEGVKRYEQTFRFSPTQTESVCQVLVQSQ